MDYNKDEDFGDFGEADMEMNFSIGFGMELLGMDVGFNMDTGSSDMSFDVRGGCGFWAFDTFNFGYDSVSETDWSNGAAIPSNVTWNHDAGDASDSHVATWVDDDAVAGGDGSCDGAGTMTEAACHAANDVASEYSAEDAPKIEAYTVMDFGMYGTHDWGAATGMFGLGMTMDSRTKTYNEATDAVLGYCESNGGLDDVGCAAENGICSIIIIPDTIFCSTTNII
jgi:hypothetical protein